MAQILFREDFDSFVKTIGSADLVPEGRTKKHVVNASDLRGEIGKKTVLKDYDEAKVDVVQILGAVNKFSGFGNVVVVESQGYKVINERTSDSSSQVSHQ